MKKYFLWTLLFFLFAAFPSYVFAHFPKVIGNTVITLHVEPNDYPTPGEQAALYFLFSNNFNLESCTCTISINEQGKQIFQKQLNKNKSSKPSIWGTSMPYIFPQDDVYQITLDAKPKIDKTFKPFTVSWYFRVYPNVSVTNTKPRPDFPILPVVGIGGSLSVLLGIFIKKQVLDADEKSETSAKKKLK